MASAVKGIFGIYKPKGPTSHDVVNKLRKLTGERTIGHAGTLDPLASGVLVVGIGREATKKLNAIVAKEKEYIAKIKLGITSTTDDEEGEKKELRIKNKVLREDVEEILKKFTGIIKQVPPVYSAVKVKGQPAHRRARKGEKIALEPREVEIKIVDVLEYKWPYLTLRAVTGPGVYIRALARDIGDALGTGGYLAELERIRVGEFTKENSLPFGEIEENFLFKL